jgi:hypothetical protein
VLGPEQTKRQLTLRWAAVEPLGLKLELESAQHTVAERSVHPVLAHPPTFGPKSYEATSTSLAGSSINASRAISSWRSLALIDHTSQSLTSMSSAAMTRTPGSHPPHTRAPRAKSQRHCRGEYIARKRVERLVCDQFQPRLRASTDARDGMSKSSHALVRKKISTLTADG